MTVKENSLDKKSRFFTVSFYCKNYQTLCLKIVRFVSILKHFNIYVLLQATVVILYSCFIMLLFIF